MEKTFKCKVCEHIFEKKEYLTLYSNENDYFCEKEFDYAICPNCDSIQIVEIQNNLEAVYDDSYYSFSNHNKILDYLLFHSYNDYFKIDLIGKITKIFLPYEEIWNTMANLLKNEFITYESSILDIGCGSGTFLKYLSRVGFKKLEGIDPFLNKDFNNSLLKLYKTDINQFNPNKKYDLIFFKDSLEHVLYPIKDLNKSIELLKDEGMLIITIPLKNGIMWDNYKEYCYVFCPPAHIIVPSIKGMQILAKKSGLKVKKIIFNSDGFEILQNEDKINHKIQFSRGSYTKSFLTHNPIKKIYYLYIKRYKTRLFPNKNMTLNELNDKVKKFNLEKRTDHAIFILKKI